MILLSKVPKLITRKAGRYSLLVMWVLLLIPCVGQNSAVASDCNTTMTTRIDQSYEGPVFVDAYWTESSASLSSDSTTAEREVGPGEGRATLAVVLLNRSPIDISAAVGYLQLPKGYEPAGASIYPEAKTVMDADRTRLGFNTPAVASFDSIIPAKSSFTLYFDINVLDNADIGTQITKMVVQYYRVSDPGICTSAQLLFPLFLSGKTILDVSTTDNYLVPNAPNTVNVSIVNKGSANATGVVASIINLGESRSSGSSSSDGSVVLQSSQTKLINLGENMFNIGTIPANSGVTLTTVIFPSNDAAGTVQNMDVQITYGNGYGDKKTAVVRTGLVIQPNPVGTSVGLTYDDSNDSHILTAEKLQDLSFVVTNNSPSLLSNLIVSLTPQSTTLTVVGDSKWKIPVLEPDQQKKISTKVIAAKSMIDTPTSFTVNLDYVSDGESKTDALSLGAFVTGSITLNIYDLSVSYVGDNPTLVGNILNQGNTAALYTNIQLVGEQQVGKTIASDSSSNKTNSNQMPAQYIGDISADSSIPFSIPLGQNSLKPGDNPIKLKVVYADDLKNFHEVSLDSQVHFEQRPPPNSERRQGSSFGQIQTLLIPIIGTGAAAVAVVVVKKQRSSKKKSSSQNNFESEIDSLLDEHANKDKK